MAVTLILPWPLTTPVQGRWRAVRVSPISPKPRITSAELPPFTTEDLIWALPARGAIPFGFIGMPRVYFTSATRIRIRASDGLIGILSGTSAVQLQRRIETVTDRRL